MIYWAPLLHFYQPPLQIFRVLKKVCDESYRPLLALFRQYPHARVTININAVLTEMLYEYGQGDVIEGMIDLAAKGQIEFTGSGKYHPILPLIPRAEMIRQIRRNHLTNRHFFGEVYAPRGFFPPELCYSQDIVEPIVETRHDWVLLSGIACPVAWPTDVVHRTSSGEDSLAVLFRDDILSNKISFQSIDGKGFFQHLGQLGAGGNGKDMYVVTAMDAETFGHHIQNWEKLFLGEVYEALTPITAEADVRQMKLLTDQHKQLLDYQASSHEIKNVFISELLGIFKSGQEVEPRPSSWSSTEQDLRDGNYYPLWKNKHNPIHQMQWDHLDITLGLVNQAIRVADNQPSRKFANIARELMDPAFHSCQCWWADANSGRWDINMVSHGLLQQREVMLNAYRAIWLSGIDDSRKKLCYYQVTGARDLANKIHDLLLTSPKA